MTHTQNSEQIVRNHFEKLWNAKQLNTLEEYCSPEVELHVGEEVLHGCNAVRNAVSTIFEAFPNIHFNIDDIISTQDRVIVRWTGKGTHQGPFMRIPATGKNISYWGISIYELRDNKITRQWGTADMYVLLAHLRGEKPEITLKRAA